MTVRDVEITSTEATGAVTYKNHSELIGGDEDTVIVGCGVNRGSQVHRGSPRVINTGAV